MWIYTVFQDIKIPGQICSDLVRESVGSKYACKLKNTNKTKWVQGNELFKNNLCYANLKEKKSLFSRILNQAELRFGIYFPQSILKKNSCHNTLVSCIKKCWEQQIREKR